MEDHILQRQPPDCLETDQPTAALVMDLKQRGMLKDTLVLWSSEFGRTSFARARRTPMLDAITMRITSYGGWQAVA